jgi:two-component sensor histidine kinase
LPAHIDPTIGPSPDSNGNAAVPLPRWPVHAIYRLVAGRTATAINLGIFALLVIVTAISWLIYDARRDLLADAEDTAADTALFLTDHASRLFEASDLALSEASNAAAAMSWDEIATSRPLWQRLRDLNDRLRYVDHIWLNDASGELRMSTVGFPTPPSNAADRDSFFVHKNPGSGLFVSQLIIGRVTAQPTFLLSRRLEASNGELRGVVSVTFDPAYFQRFYESLNLRYQPIVSLRRALDGATLVRHGETDAPDFAIPAGSATGLISPARDAHADAVHAWRKVENLPLFVTVTIPKGRLDRDWAEGVWIYALVGLLATLALWPLAASTVRHAQRDREANALLEQRVAERTRQLRDANAQLETLFQEVHHRVKNNLQVITSLLHLQAARSEDSETRAALQQSVDRIHAMSLVHQLLYSSHQLAVVDFATYLRTLVDSLQCAYGTAGRIVITLDVEPAWFNLNTAIPLCLIVNEVLSNAYKHAFPDDRTGTIDVMLKRDGEGWTLVIRDDGIGMTPKTDRQHGSGLLHSAGLGLQIIESLIGQLDGTLDFTRDNGTVFTLTFPAPPDMDAPPSASRG